MLGAMGGSEGGGGVEDGGGKEERDIGAEDGGVEEAMGFLKGEGGG